MTRWTKEERKEFAEERLQDKVSDEVQKKLDEAFKEIFSDVADDFCKSDENELLNYDQNEMLALIVEEWKRLNPPKKR